MYIKLRYFQTSFFTEKLYLRKQNEVLVIQIANKRGKILPLQSVTIRKIDDCKNTPLVLTPQK